MRKNVTTAPGFSNGQPIFSPQTTKDGTYSITPLTCFSAELQNLTQVTKCFEAAFLSRLLNSLSDWSHHPSQLVNLLEVALSCFSPG